MDTIKSPTETSPGYTTDEKTIWTGLLGSSATFALFDRFLKPSKSIVLVCPNESKAEEVYYDEAKFFHQQMGLSQRLLFYPARESDFSPSQFLSNDTSEKRMSALYHASNQHPFIIVTSIRALAQKTIPPTIFKKNVFALMLHDEVHRDNLVKDFTQAGYERETTCSAMGTFSVRGDIIDFHSPNHPYPIRIEFFGDQIERISYFDPVHQTSIQESQLEYVEWIAAREILLHQVHPKDVIRRVKTLADDLNLPPTSRLHIEDAIQENVYLPAMDHLFPLFYEQPGSLMDFCEHAEWVMYDPLSLQTEIQNLQFELEQVRSSRKEKLACRPESFLLPLPVVENQLTQKVQVLLSEVDYRPSSQTRVQAFDGIELHQGLQSLLIQKKKSERPFQPLADAIAQWTDQGKKIVLVASARQGLDRLAKILQAYLPNHSFKFQERWQNNAQPFEISLTLGEFGYGFSSKQPALVFVTETEIFGEQKLKQASHISQENILESLEELSVGDPIVHIDHGIGFYQGLQKMKINQIEQDFLLIHYQGDDKLFLPIYRLNRIHKYISADGKKPKIDKLGSNNWEQSKKKAQKIIEEMAQELIELYARRKVAKGYAYGSPDESYVNFEAEFPFEETRDQLKTIEEIFSDLESEKPMDRLVCGDVGFGKTEMALRAAYRVAAEGKQVAVLVPTTILCQQHFQTFKKRFANFPMQIDFLSRFKDRKDAAETIEKLKSGHIDIIVGTHRLLSKDVEFSNLGLLILDEEHRFGVKHKEHIKKFRNKIDVLTLTATPIPRTLQLSMTGIRDLSVINTPPLDRKSVHTILCNFEDSTIRNAVMKEMGRKGQVFFLHNRVESIYTMRTYLSKILPEVSIQVAHGQMDQEELEKTMLDFLNHKFDMLLCTTIIESGLDIPNANTLLVNRADTFGLSQLYQIRGRVGRSHREAYAYFMVPDKERMSKDAIKRLRVLKQFTDLGSGLKISLHDMEIRGAGNLLGAKQSGQISTVGFELYSQLLEREVRRLKGENVKEDIEPEIQVSMAAFIPDDYIDDQTERLRFYKRLSACKDEKEYEQLRNEMLDRFGPFPQTVENLFEVVDLKMVARDCGVISLKATGFSPVIEFSDHASINMDKLLALVKTNRGVKLTPDQKLVLQFDSDVDPVQEAKKMLRALQDHGKN